MSPPSSQPRAAVTTSRSCSRRLVRVVRRGTILAAGLVFCSLALPVSHTLSAQPSAKAKSKQGAMAPSLVGTWSGTATVPLKDSSIVVPVTYNFAQTAGTLGGMAMVPGQGSGPISNVVRDGARVQFRVTAPEGKLLEHDGKIGADGAIEGLVNLDKLPVAKFRIMAKPSVPTGK